MNQQAQRDVERTLGNLEYQIRMTKGDMWYAGDVRWGVLMEMIFDHLLALNRRLTEMENAE